MGQSGGSLDSFGPLAIGLGAAADLFCAAKAAEGASPRTVEWYRMALVRAVRLFGEARPVDAIAAAELRAWFLELRASLAPESIAGYVRGLKAFGNWCAAEGLAAAAAFRGLRRPKVPRRLIARFSDPELRSLLAIGAGEAGQAAAYLARARGASVDRELFGGSCPYWAASCPLDAIGENRPGPWCAPVVSASNA